MSQEQPERPAQQGGDQPDSIKYGDVFHVSGELASQPIAPKDAAAMQAAESTVMGKAQKGGVAAVMQSAANLNVRTGAVESGAVTRVVREEGVNISDANVEDKRIVTEAIGDQILGQYVQPAPTKMSSPAGALDRDAITIGEALEAAALSAAGDKPVDQSDAAAIQAAEMRALGSNKTILGGIGAAAQSAATRNTRTLPYEDKTKLSDVLTGVAEQLPADKAVTAEDAERVVGAEIRNRPEMTTTAGGVAESIAAAARLNQDKSSD